METSGNLQKLGKDFFETQRIITETYGNLWKLTETWQRFCQNIVKLFKNLIETYGNLPKLGRDFVKTK